MRDAECGIVHGTLDSPLRVRGDQAQGAREVRRIEAERLIKQAERDLENARKNVEIGAYEVAAFLANQAVEKYLKGVWITLRGEAAPHTHSLIELGDQLGVSEATREHLGYLNADYTTARYPDAANGVPYEVYDRPMAERKVRAAEEALDWLRRLTQTRK